MAHTKNKIVRLLASPGMAVLFGVALNSPAQAQVASASTPLYGCVLREGNEGKFRIVDPGVVCKSNEVRVQWNLSGPQGPKGDAGPAGAAGLPGSAGATGLPGPAGTPGAVGPAGAAGAAGASDAIGATGAAGPAGSTGLAGVQGAQGPTGPAGVIGPVGATGAAGAIGAAGTTGAAGPMGAVGLAGPAGPQGPAGPAGIANTTAGPQGPQGAAGLAGPGGPVGATGNTGPQGAGGAPGAQGVSGAAGAQGPAGQLAPSGTIQGSVTTCDANGASITAPAGTLVYIPGRAFTAATDATGAFLIDHVPAGTYSVAVEEGGATVVTKNGVSVASTASNVGTLAATCGVAPPPSGGSCGNCEAPTPYCSTANMECVQCLYDAHCVMLDSNYCINNECF